MQRALGELETLKKRAEQVGVTGHREYNTGWHAAQDLGNLLMVSEAIARSAIERKESRGGHFRQDYPEKDQAFATLQHRRAAQSRRRDAGFARADCADARRVEAGDRGEQVAAASSSFSRTRRLPEGDSCRLS